MTNKRKRKTIFVIGILFIFGILYVGILQYKISQYYHTEVPKNADYLIVLGARVRGTIPSLALKARIDTAAEYLRKNKNTMVIASGGKGPGEDISEAANIKEELIKRGIEANRILLEEQSTDTYENVKFSKKILPDSKKLGIIVTNNFHLYRAVSIAKDEHLTIYGLPAITPKSAIIKSYTREYLAITKYYFKSLLS